MPRPPGAGRKKGTPNRATRDVRAATQKKGGPALRELWKLCTSATDEKVRKAALDTWLAYAFGRPVDRQELTGADGAPLHGMGAEEAGRRVAYILAKAEKEAAPPPPPRAVDPALRQAFEAAQRARFADMPTPEPDPEPVPAVNVVPFPEAALPQIGRTPAILTRDKAS